MTGFKLIGQFLVHGFAIGPGLGKWSERGVWD